MILALLLAAQAAAAASPDALRAEVAITVPAQYRLVEGVASDGRAIWFSSVMDRKLLEYRNGRFREVAFPDKLGAPLGIVWDSRRNLLWVAANCPDGLIIPGCSGSALVALDRRGRVRASLRPANAKPFMPGDVSVQGGRVFVSDSMNGALYSCSGRCADLTTIIAPRPAGSAQASLVYDKGRKLLLADYDLGLISIDLATGREERVLRESGRPLQGVDGMIADGDGSILGVRNAVVPGVVVRIRLNRDRVSEPVVAAVGPAVRDPTQLVRHGACILMVADSQWASHLPDKAGHRAGNQRPTAIVSFPARRSGGSPYPPARCS